MSELIYYQRNKDVILNRAKDKEEARDKYKNVFKEEKNKKREYGKNRCHNMSEEKKTKTKRISKNYREAKKSQYDNE